MKFEQVKYTEVTELAHKINLMYKDSGYTRIFICADVWDVWLVRILPGYNEEYEKQEDIILCERDKIPHDDKCQPMTIARAKEILENDSFENWDVAEYSDEEQIIEDLADIYGINNLQETELDSYKE